MQKLIINKNVYDTMLGHFGDKLETIAKEFNEYLTPENVVADYRKAYYTMNFNGSQGKMIAFISHLEPSVKNKLNCKKVKQLDLHFESWFEPEFEFSPDELLGKYFQLFIIRKLDYLGKNIIERDDEGNIVEHDRIHSNFLSLAPDCDARRITALLGILLSNCSVSDQKRIMTILELKYFAECVNDDNSEKFKVSNHIIDFFINAYKYPN